ncbi:MAG: SLC13 family permease [Deltaproteobacteria bacterium]|nr:MAG: SLC13 family permease [Deltaproteobacteria bacterium]
MDLVALMALLTLMVTGVLTVPEALAGFSDPVVLMIAALFVVGEGLFRTGVASSIGQLPLRLGGDNPRVILAVIMLLVAVLSAFMSSTGTVAVMLPVVVGIAARLRISPSKLLLPLSIASLLGGMLTLIGTPPNLIVANALEAHGETPFSFFAFTPFGLVMLVVGMIFMLTVGMRLLPSHAPVAPEDDAMSVREIEDAWQLQDRVRRARVPETSDLVGRRLDHADLRTRFDVSVLDIQRAETDTPRRPTRSSGDRPDSTRPDSVFASGDTLWLDGDDRAIEQLVDTHGLTLLEEDTERDRLPRNVGLVEVILPPRSNLLGRTLRSARFRDRFRVNVAAVRRLGSPIEGPLPDVRLRFGDTLLVEGPWKAIEALREERNDLVVAAAPRELEQALRPTARAPLAIALLCAMLVVLTAGWLPAVTTILLAALLMVLSGCVQVGQIYRSVNWISIVLIAAILPMATALDKSGGMALIIDGFTDTIGTLGPLAVLIGLFLLTSIFSQVISNTATAVLVAPIAIGMAESIGISPYPLLMTVAIAASTAFATPIASPVNTLVLGPGAYRFNDFLRIGLPLQGLLLIATILTVPLLLPF